MVPLLLWSSHEKVDDYVFIVSVLGWIAWETVKEKLAQLIGGE